LGFVARPIEETVKDTVLWWKDNLNKTHSGLRFDSVLPKKTRTLPGGA
jgi:hypothetical protein